MSSKSLLGSIFVAVLTLILSSCTLHVVHVNAATEQSSGDKTPKIDVPATDVQLKVANPSITPDNRTPLAYGAEISMGCSTSGATIRYTTGDGSQDEPTATTGEEYDPTDKPIIEVASTFKAKAFKDNYTDSDTTTIAYKLTGHVGTSDLGEVSFNMVYVQGGYIFPVSEHILPLSLNDNATASVGQAYEIAKTETTYELWSAVYNWAVNGVGPDGAGKGAYTFNNPGRQGGDWVSATDPVGTDQHPVTTVSWCDSMVWTNALTEYYNAYNESELSCVYKGATDPVRASTPTGRRQTDNCNSTCNSKVETFMALGCPEFGEACASITSPDMYMCELVCPPEDEMCKATCAGQFVDQCSSQCFACEGEFAGSCQDAFDQCENAVQDPSATGFRLLSVSEWDLAARYKGSNSSNGAIEMPADSGMYWTPSAYASGATADYTDTTATQAVAWYRPEATSTNAVATKASNELGIFDMSGNAMEWCFDAGPMGPSIREQRGGSWEGVSGDVRVGRWDLTDSIGTVNEATGFRFARSVGPFYR